MKAIRFGGRRMLHVYELPKSCVFIILPFIWQYFVSSSVLMFI